MNREPLPLYIFRFLLAAGLFGFMLMLYWSSSLVEDNVRSIQQQLREMEQRIDEMRSEQQIIRRDLLEAVVDDQQQQQQLLQRLLQKVSRKGLTLPTEMEQGEVSVELLPEDGSIPLVGETQLPNLYIEDSFPKTTLPNLLPRGFLPHGVRRSAMYGRPDNLHPFSGWAAVSQWLNMATLPLGTGHFGKYESYGPAMATRMEQRIDPGTGKPEYWLFLRDNVYWQPLDPRHLPDGMELAPHFRKRHKVTAHDYKFWFDAVMNPFNQEPSAISLRNYVGDIEEMRVVDDHTLVVRWRTEPVKDKSGEVTQKAKYIAKGWTGAIRPLARFVYQYFPDGSKIIEDDSDPEAYRKNSVWAQNFAEHWAKNIIVSNGPWLFSGYTDRQIRFRRNPDHFDPRAVLVTGMIEEIKDSPDTIWQDFRAGRLDTYSLNPQQLVELETFLESDQYREQKAAGKGISRLDYLSRVYSYIGWNQARPYFASKKVRQALTMAIDRKRIIDQILNGMGEEISGSFFKNSPSYDQSIKPWPYDPRRARRLLEEDGWYDADGDGVLDKNIDGTRVPFSFAITYYVKNPTSKAVVEYVATALKEIGIEVRLNGVDTADLSAIIEDKSFDALLLAWALGTPPEEPRQLWHSEGAKEKGSSNHIGFVNSEADAIIEDLQYEYEPEERLRLYHRFHRILHEEQPYTFLYTPKATLLYRDYLENVFIPAERQDLVPGADVAEPDSSIWWLKNNG